PLFPKSFRNELQIINLVISADDENDPDMLAVVGLSAAGGRCGIPVSVPLGAVRVALVDGQLVANPTYKQLAASPLEIVIAGTEDAVLMVESGGRRISEEQMLEALAFGHEQCKQIARIQKELAAQAGKPQWAFDTKAGAAAAIDAGVKERATAKVVKALAIHEKQARAQALEGVFEEVWAAL